MVKGGIKIIRKSVQDTEKKTEKYITNIKGVGEKITKKGQMRL